MLVRGWDFSPTSSLILLAQNMTDPRDVAGLQSGATSGLLSSDASLQRGRPGGFPTLH